MSPAIRPLARAFAAGVMAVFLAAPAAADRSDPVRLVEGFHATLLGAMQNAEALGYAGRHRLLAPAIGKTFHLRLMSRMVAGRRHWKGFSGAQRKRFVAAFSGLVAATYADRFDGWSGQSFRTLGSAELRPGTVLVKTEVVSPGKAPTRLNYVLRRLRDGWHAVDVYLKGSISEVATKRSEYAAILRREGVDALVRRIGETAARLAAEAGE
ncbi:MAG: ABC transporter substrate-binding protein [Defluviicoccus sp.]|nr:ABC transporter substrate-binding protein [Defluviicoccus sp.]MDE0384095.1 ABC transporter substrate-binding protein [Defluviicoccus sp.]